MGFFADLADRARDSASHYLAVGVVAGAAALGIAGSAPSPAAATAPGAAASGPTPVADLTSDPEARRVIQAMRDWDAKQASLAPGASGKFEPRSDRDPRPEIAQGPALTPEGINAVRNEAIRLTDRPGNPNELVPMFSTAGRSPTDVVAVNKAVQAASCEGADFQQRELMTAKRTASVEAYCRGEIVDTREDDPILTADVNAERLIKAMREAHARVKLGDLLDGGLAPPGLAFHEEPTARLTAAGRELVRREAERLHATFVPLPDAPPPSPEMQARLTNAEREAQGLPDLPRSPEKGIADAVGGVGR